MTPNDPNRPGGYQGPVGYPSPPQSGQVPPPQPYAAPPGYPPPYGYPRKSKAPLWIGIGVGVVAIIGLAIHFVMVDNAWLHPEPASRAPLTEAQKKGYAYVPPNQRGASAEAATGITGRWCTGGTYVQFDPDGRVYDSRANVWGSWQEVSPGRVNMTFDARTVALEIRVSGNTMTISTPDTGSQQLTRC